MRVAIIRPKNNCKSPDIKIYESILEFNGIEIVRVDAHSNDLLKQLAGVDAVIYKWGHTHDEIQHALTYLPVLDYDKNVRIFPNLPTSWHYDDKIRQDVLLKHYGFPFVESFIFWEKSQACQWAKSAQYPVVFKLTHGAGARSVYLVKGEHDAIRIINKMFSRGITQEKLSVPQIYKTRNHSIGKTIKEVLKIMYQIGRGTSDFWFRSKNYVYFQKFCAGNNWDTRVTTAGLRAHAFRRFVREGDFRASGSNRWDISPEKIDMRMVRIALDISKHFGFQAMAYDFVTDENNDPRIVEISYCYGGAGFPDFMNGYWDFDLNWHGGRYWPQYFELVDLLDLPDLICPQIEVNTKYTKARIEDV